MANTVGSHPIAASPDDVEWLVDQVHAFGSAAAAAKALDLERTLVWRATKGRKISRASVLEIRQRREAASATNPTPSHSDAQQLSVANIRFMLQYLLHALDALDRDERANALRLNK